MSIKVQAKIQKWGNGLGLRVAGVLRDIPQLKEGAIVNIQITEKGFSVKKMEAPKKIRPTYSESELLEGLTPHKAHADSLPTLLPHEGIA